MSKMCLCIEIQHLPNMFCPALPKMPPRRNNAKQMCPFLNSISNGSQHPKKNPWNIPSPPNKPKQKLEFELRAKKIRHVGVGAQHQVLDKIIWSVTVYLVLRSGTSLIYSELEKYRLKSTLRATCCPSANSQSFKGPSGLPLTALSAKAWNWARKTPSATSKSPNYKTSNKMTSTAMIGLIHFSGLPRVLRQHFLPMKKTWSHGHRPFTARSRLFRWSAFSSSLFGTASFLCD